MDQPFALDGYVVTDLLGFGTTGEVWRGRHVATGDPVALKRLWEPMPPDRMTRLRREIGVLREISGGHIVGVREIHELVENEYVLVMELAAGGSLASLIGRRGRLHPSEVVTILGPLASLLADAHDRGLRHGDITPSNVVFSADGRPMLADFGLALILGEGPLEDNGYRDPAAVAGATPPPAADVFGLAAVGYAALTGVPPRPDSTGRVPAVVELGPWVPPALAVAVEAGLAPDPTARPGAERLASTVLRSCSANPVRLSGPKKTATPAAEAATSRRTSRVPRPLALASVVAGVFVCAALAGVGWAHVNSPAAAALGPERPAPKAAAHVASQSSGVAPVVAGPNWKRIVSLLDDRRAIAWTMGYARSLHAVYESSSPIFKVEQSALRILHSENLHATHFSLVVKRVSVVSAGAKVAQLKVTDRITNYTIRDAANRIVAWRPAKTQTYLLTIARHGTKWKVRAVAPA